MKNIFIVILLIVSSPLIKGQGEVITFLQTQELSYDLTKEYLSPMAKMLHGNTHAGWYSTAKTHRFLGFDIALSMSATTTPSNQRGYYIDQVTGFEQNYVIKDGSFSIAANMAGETNDYPVIRNTTDGREIQLPKGSGKDRLSLPVLSAGIGLPYDFELRIKVMPKVGKGSLGDFSQYGIGIKHSIKEYLPLVEDVPVLSLAVLGSYSFVCHHIALDYPDLAPSGHSLEGEMNGFSSRLLIGIDVPVFSAYMGVGYVSSSIDYSLNGNYYVGNPALLQEETDPLSVNYKYGEMILDFGVKAKLGMVELFVGYAPAEYGTLSFGAGMALR